VTYIEAELSHAPRSGRPGVLRDAIGRRHARSGRRLPPRGDAGNSRKESVRIFDGGFKKISSCNYSWRRQTSARRQGSPLAISPSATLDVRRDWGLAPVIQDPDFGASIAKLSARGVIDAPLRDGRVSCGVCSDRCSAMMTPTSTRKRPMLARTQYVQAPPVKTVCRSYRRSLPRRGTLSYGDALQGTQSVTT
jgi:hypothetical protein